VEMEGSGGGKRWRQEVEGRGGGKVEGRNEGMQNAVREIIQETWPTSGLPMNETVSDQVGNGSRMGVVVTSGTSRDTTEGAEKQEGHQDRRRGRRRQGRLRCQWSLVGGWEDDGRVDGRRHGNGGGEGKDPTAKEREARRRIP
jgi:hypothetical protein